MVTAAFSGNSPGQFRSAPFLIMQVQIDGGLYTYYGSGQLIPLGGGSPYFRNATCTGKGYQTTDQETFDFLFSKLAGGPSRIVFRVASSPMDLGPISAWQYTTESDDVNNQDLWELDSDGMCIPAPVSPYTGLLAELDSVPAPPDGVGPLTIG